VMVQHGHGLSPWAPKPDPEAERRAQRKERWLWFVRYGVPVLIAISGLLVMVLATDHQVGIEIGAMLLGAAIAVFLLNFFFRMGVSGDEARDREEEARRYFDQHGRWPDDPVS
jgi:Na+/melibiose symporter-like transporter